MTSGDFKFQIGRPDAPLSRFVSGVWHARGRIPHDRERILPSAEAVLLLVLGAPLRMTEPREGGATHEVRGAWITGPHERPILNEPLAETHVVGAVFTAGGVAAFLEGSVAEIANRILPLAQVHSSLGSGRRLLAALNPCPFAASARGSGRAQADPLVERGGGRRLF